MFSQAKDERLQFICREQNRFRKGDQDEDESLSDEAELHPEDDDDEPEVIDEIKDYLRACYLSACNRIEGILAKKIWQNYHEQLSADYIIKENDIQQGINKTLKWITTFLEENNIRILQIGLP
ncbi:25299_t:CDS:2 [Dentiscutata erythropus]|uniref:25299_t:CDS:1 n=1 Tax=Dentiscutata erythropus TaxID=1348616 RepID=A0A9N8VSN5_9GLOM|nr:25299_t:CDS:2 [Dentiscutata erythropus]